MRRHPPESAHTAYGELVPDAVPAAHSGARAAVAAGRRRERPARAHLAGHVACVQRAARVVRVGAARAAADGDPQPCRPLVQHEQAHVRPIVPHERAL